MSKHQFDDETLMAFADGELDEEQSLALEEALATDDALADRLAIFLDSRQLVGDTLKKLIDEPVPEAFLASVRQMAQDADSRAAPSPEKILAFSPTPRAAKPAMRNWMMPLAASILAVVTGVAGFTLGRTGSVGTNAGMDIATMLNEQRSGQDLPLGESGRILHIIATFRDERGELCREYELKDSATSTLTVACRQNGDWNTRLALTAPRTEGYVAASSQDTVNAYLSSINAAAPLTQDEERAALGGP